MKKRILSIILISTLSISLFVGCGDKKEESNNQPPQQEQEQQDSTDKPTSSDSSNDDSNIVAEGTTEEKIEAKFTETMELLYNRDYSNEEKAIEAENYIKENFTPEGAKDMVNKIVSYDSEVAISDLLITLVKEIDNNDDRYESMYEVRYNASVSIGKPSIYSDIIAKVVVDKDGKIFIESINDFEF